MNDTKPVALTPSEPTSTRLIASLAIAGFLSGVIIIAIYVVTLPTITANKARELREAVFQVLPGVTQMQPLYDNGSELLPGTGTVDATLYAGYDAAGRFIGYAMPSAGPGFQDIIALLYGYQPAERQVVGMAILDSRETPGLGDKIYKDASFVANFNRLRIDPTIVTVKKGRRTRDNEVDAITGATISSKAVVRIINEGNERWLARLPRPGSEAPLPATAADSGPMEQ